MKTLQVHGKGKEYIVGKILCLGRNYVEHAQEMQSEIPNVPIVFIKPSTAIINSDEDIIIPKISQQLHHEVELIVAIAKEGKNISSEQALEYVLGYGVGLDMTLRDIQTEAKKKGLPWSVAKGFDTSAPISDIIAASKIKNPQDLRFRCKVNGTVRQETTTSKMIFPIEKIIEYLSSIFTLEPGDLIFTGTPEGAGEVKTRDIIEAELVGYTSIRHRVRTA
ncbi:MAG: fumarylacetoacetate hydrolase family protein [Ignavibacteriae bacterium]|nr:fumarylacetoacetate hydrolase family protein [Ignavibacteriota bacterium]